MGARRCYNCCILRSKSGLEWPPGQQTFLTAPHTEAKQHNNPLTLKWTRRLPCSSSPWIVCWGGCPSGFWSLGCSEGNAFAWHRWHPCTDPGQKCHGKGWHSNMYIGVCLCVDEDTNWNVREFLMNETVVSQFCSGLASILTCASCVQLAGGCWRPWVADPPRSLSGTLKWQVGVTDNKVVQS